MRCVCLLAFSPAVLEEYVEQDEQHRPSSSELTLPCTPLAGSRPCTSTCTTRCTLALPQRAQPRARPPRCSTCAPSTRPSWAGCVPISRTSALKAPCGSSAPALGAPTSLLTPRPAPSFPPSLPPRPNAGHAPVRAVPRDGAAAAALGRRERREGRRTVDQARGEGLVPPRRGDVLRRAMTLCASVLVRRERKREPREQESHEARRSVRASVDVEFCERQVRFGR